jgi:catechol 2,3-dioxygenase-like lactoylglutathione lyase family enzyme
MPSMILQIHHAQVCIPEGGLEKAREFYCGLLGLKEVPRPFGPHGFWVQVGDRMMHFGIDDLPDRQRSKQHVAYQVSDLKSMRNKLQSAGFAIEDPQKMPGHDRFQIRDPFGNLVEFIQPVADPI